MRNYLQNRQSLTNLLIFLHFCVSFRWAINPASFGYFVHSVPYGEFLGVLLLLFPISGKTGGSGLITPTPSTGVSVKKRIAL
jgi:hypothetical protein